MDILYVFRKTAWPNDFLQLEHVLALTPLWVSVRVYVQSWANNIWQWSQVYAVLYCCGLPFASPDFLLYRMTSHILNKSSSMLLSIQAVSSLGLALIGKHTAQHRTCLLNWKITIPQQRTDLERLWFGCFAESHFLLNFGGLQFLSKTDGIETKYQVHSRWWFKHKRHKTKWVKLVNFVSTKNPWNRDSGS